MVLLQLHLGQNRFIDGKGWATQLLKEIAAPRVHFSLGWRKKQVSASLVFVFFAALNARAAWIEKESRSETSSVHALIHRYLVLEDSETGERSSIELALFATKSFTLRVIDQPVEPRVDLAETMEREKCLAGVNGGYFDPDYTPIGLLIVDGKTIAPLQRARLLTGVLTASSRGIQIMRIGEFSRRLTLDAAVECGPMIVDLGSRVRGLDDTRTARRTFAAIARDDRAALGFCSEVTLADLAKILTAQFASDFKIQRALNLDGGSSSGFWFKRQNGSAFSVPEQKTVRDFVGIVPR